MPIAITEVLFRSAVILWLILIFSILSTFHTGMKKKIFNSLYEWPYQYHGWFCWLLKTGNTRWHQLSFEISIVYPTFKYLFCTVTFDLIVNALAEKLCYRSNKTWNCKIFKFLTEHLAWIWLKYWVCLFWFL